MRLRAALLRRSGPAGPPRRGERPLCHHGQRPVRARLGGADRTIRVWCPDDGRPLTVLTGHTAAVTGVCPVTVGDREVLASTSLDRTVRLWDPATGRALRTIPVHHQALACLYADATLILGLDRGLLALAINRV